MNGEAAVVYSGGSDSTCAAALMAERFSRVHLLTFIEEGTKASPIPEDNVERLRSHFGAERFLHAVMPIDRLLEHLSYDRYPANLARHGFFMLSTPGFSTLSWHARAIVYCLERGIGHAADGLTRELMHFPGHMDGVVDEIRALYLRFGIDYLNPVRDWEVPVDRQFLDQIIVDQHGFLPFGEEPARKTTGRYLFERGILPHPDVKGSRMDRGMQHGCYPFVVFNLFAFWLYLGWRGYGDYAARMTGLFREKTKHVGDLIEEHAAGRPGSRLAGLLEA